MNYIFVDIDGPLLPAKLNFLQENYKFHKTKKGLPTFDPFAVRLHNLIADYADAKIVLSTNWSWFLEEKKLKDLLYKCGLRFDYARVALTPKSKSSKRSHEILWWIEDNAEEDDKFLIIDDLPLCALLDTNYNIKHIEVDLVNGMVYNDYVKALKFFDIDVAKLGYNEFNIPIKSIETVQKEKESLDLLYACAF